MRSPLTWTSPGSSVVTSTIPGLSHLDPDPEFGEVLGIKRHDAFSMSIRLSVFGGLLLRGATAGPTPSNHNATTSTFDR